MAWSVLRHPVMLLLLAVSLVPTLAGLVMAVGAGADAGRLASVLQAPGAGLSLASALWTGALATILALLLAHLAVALAASSGWRRRLNTLVLPLLAMPHLAVGIGLALVLAPSGLLLRLLSPWATGFELPPDWMTVNDPAGASLLLGLVLKETAFLVLALVAALGQVPSETLLVQAQSLGYGRLKAWLVLVAPELQAQIRLPLAAVLVFGISNVEVAIPLGPRLPATFPVLLWQWFTDPDPAVHALAWSGTLILLAVCVLALAVAAALGRLLRGVLRLSVESGRRRTEERRARIAAGGLLAFGWTLGLLAIAAIGLRAAGGAWRFPSLLPASSAASVWPDVAASMISVTPATLGLAATTALVGVLLVLPAAETCRSSAAARRSVGALLFLPLIVPQMTFLFGVQVLLVRLGIDGSAAAVLWSHLLFALPYLWGLLAPARASIDPRLADVATVLGAAPTRTWFAVTAPLMIRSLFLALAVAFSVSVALYLPTLFTGAGRIGTAATEAAAAAASGNLRLASSYALLLAAAPLGAFAAAWIARGLVYRGRRGVPS